MRVIELLYPKTSNKLRSGFRNSKPCPCCNGGKGPCSHGKSVCGTCQGKGTVPIEHKPKDNDCDAEITNEATTVAPNTKKEADRLRDLFSSPLEVENAAAALIGIIEDDGLNQEFEHCEPGEDALPIIYKWLELNMPKMLRHAEELMGDGQGLFSPLHGIDEPDMPGGSENFISNYTA